MVTYVYSVQMQFFWKKTVLFRSTTEGVRLIGYVSNDIPAFLDAVGSGRLSVQN